MVDSVGKHTLPELVGLDRSDSVLVAHHRRHDLCGSQIQMGRGGNTRKNDGCSFVLGVFCRVLDLGAPFPKHFWIRLHELLCGHGMVRRPNSRRVAIVGNSNCIDFSSSSNRIFVR